jgi:hypothetical protein
MKKLILASAAAFALTSGYASAGLMLHTDDNDRKVVVNTWAGQSEDDVLGRTSGSSTSTFSGGNSFGGLILGTDENDRKTVINLWAGQREAQPAQGGESVSTFSGSRPSGGIILGSDENDNKLWINTFPR